MRAVSVFIGAALAVLTVSCSQASAQTATGLEPGVHIDPGSPAAKEYALPLAQGRRPGAEPSHQGASETLFGAGIKSPPSGGTPHSPSGSGSAGGSRVARGGDQVKAPGSRAGLPAAVLRATSAQSSGGDGSLLALVGGGVAILVLGGFGGTVLRHSRRPTPEP
jgi:hypothetical protein